MFDRSTKLSLYIGKKFLFNFLAVLVTLLLIIYMFDTIELIRRAAKIDSDIPMSVIFQMSWFKLPEVGQRLISFSILFASMITFWRMTRSYELIVARSFGLSIWQLLYPVITATLLIGFLRVVVVQHYSSIMLKKYNFLESEYLGKSSGKIRIASSGLWFKDSNETLDWIVNAESINDNFLSNVKVFYFDNDYNFTRRLDAEKAVIGEEKIELINVWNNEENLDNGFFDSMIIPSKINSKDLQEIMIQDPQISIWKMPHYINIVKKSGLDSKKIETSFFNLLFQPIFFVALMFLGVSFSLVPSRRGGVAKVIGIGIFSSFVIFFLNEVITTLGAGGKIATYIAPSIPAIIALLIGIVILIKKEDG